MCGGGFAESQNGDLADNPTIQEQSNIQEESDDSGAEGASEESDICTPAETMAAADAVAARMAAPGVSSIILPATIQGIDTVMFAAFPNATSISVADDNATYKAYNGMLFNKELTDLLLVPEGMEGAAVLPASTASVPACVFSRCTKLSAVDIPTGGTGSQSFTAWNGILYTNDLSTLVAAPASLGASATIAPECQVISEGAFWGNENLKTIVSNGAISTIEPAFTESVIKSATVVTDNTSAWDEAGFKNFASPVQPGEEVASDGFTYTLLEDYTLSVVWTGEGEAPSELTIPSTAQIDGVEYAVSTIQGEGFANQAIRTLNVPEGITSIGERAFAGCTDLDSATLAGSVTAIGASAFEGCASLSTIELGAGLRTIGASAFEGTGLAEIILPATVTSVGDRAFSACANLRAVVAQATIKNVSDAALADTSGVGVYVPYAEDGEYAWSIGPVASANHLLPYGAKVAEAVYSLNINDTVNVFAEGGYLETPGITEDSISYKASTVSASSAGDIVAKQPGTTSVTYTVGYKDMALTKTTTTIIVSNPPANKDETSEEAATEADDSDADAEGPVAVDTTADDLGFYFNDDDLTDEELAEIESAYQNAGSASTAANTSTHPDIYSADVDLSNAVEESNMDDDIPYHNDDEATDIEAVTDYESLAGTGEDEAWLDEEELPVWDEFENSEEPDFDEPKSEEATELSTSIVSAAKLSSSLTNFLKEVGGNFSISTLDAATSSTPTTTAKSYRVSVHTYIEDEDGDLEDLVVKGGWCNTGDVTGTGSWKIVQGNGSVSGDTASLGRASFSPSSDNAFLYGIGLNMPMFGNVNSSSDAQNFRLGFTDSGSGLIHTYTTWYAAKGWFNMDELGSGDAKGKYNTEPRLRNYTNIVPFAKRTNANLDSDNKFIYPFSITLNRPGYSATRWMGGYFDSKGNWKADEIVKNKGNGTIGEAISLVNDDDYSYFLEFKPNKYNLQFDKQEGSGGIDKKQVTFDGPIDSLAETEIPSRAGYDFGGYYTEKNGAGQMYFDGKGIRNSNITRYTVAKDLTLYANWIPKKYTITFQNGDKANPKTSTATVEMGAVLPTISKKPTRNDGWDFKGYYTEENGGGICYYTESLVANLDPNQYVVADNQTLYANWEKHTYYIHFDTNGGSSPHQYPQDQPVTYGDNMPSLSSMYGYSPTKENYEFLGWYAGSNTAYTQYYKNNLSKSVQTYKRTSDLTLYAVWGHSIKIIDPLGSRGSDANVKTYLIGSVNEIVDSSYGMWTRPSNLGNDWKYAGVVNSHIDANMNALIYDSFPSGSPNQLIETNGYVNSDCMYTLWYRDVSLNANSGTGAVQTSVRVYMTAGAWDYGSSSTSDNKLCFVDFEIDHNNGGKFYPYTYTSGGLNSDRSQWKPNRTSYIFMGFGHNTSSNARIYIDRFGSNVKGVSAPSVTASDFIGGTIYAKWSEFKYTIEYQTSEGTGTTASQKVGFGEAVTIKNSNFTAPTGKHFTEWSGGDGNTYQAGAYYANGLIANEDDCENGSAEQWLNGDSIVMTANWDWNTYTITYKPGTESSGDEVIDDVTVNTYPTIRNNFYEVPEGKHFKNWQRSTGSEVAPGKQSGNLATSQGANIVLTPKWEWNTYTIAYNSNGGSGSMTTTSATVNTNPFIKANGFGAPRGKRFNGWNTEPNGSGTPVAANAYYSGDLTKGTGTVTLYAQWVNDVYTITLNNDKATENGTSTIYLKYSEGYFSDIGCAETTRITSINTPKRLGYTFSNYPDLINSNGAIVGSYTQYWVDTTLTPVWTANTYTIQLMANNGTVDSKNVQFNFDQVAANAARLGGNPFEKQWHDFDKWNTVPDGSGTSYSDNALITQELAEIVAKTSTGVYALYAQWTQVYFNVKWEPNGGTYVESQMVHQGDKVPFAATTRTGYTFDAWYKDEALTQKWDFDKDLMPWNEITLYAKWTANKFTVTFKSNGGTGDDHSETYTYNLYNDSGKTQAQRLPSADNLGFAKRGNNFACWTTTPEWDGNLDSPNVFSKDEEISTNLSTGDNVTLYAQWTPITYYVFFNSNRQDNSSTITGDNMGLQELTYDKNIALKKNTIQHESYTFEGWNTVPNPTDEEPGIWIKDGETIGNLATGANVDNLRDYFDVVVLYAQWKGHPYTVSFDNNPPHAGEVTGSIPDTTFYWGLTETLPNAADILKCTNGWIFDGWNTKANGTGTAYADGAQIKNLEPEEGHDRVILYAQWRITFNVDVPSVNYINVTMNPEGEWITVDSQDVTMKSYSPVKVGVQGVGCDSNLEGLSEIMEDVSQASNLELRVTSQGTTVPLSPGTTAYDSNFYFKMEEGSSTNPSTLPVNVDLGTLPGANIRLKERVEAISGFDLWFVLGLAEQLA